MISINPERANDAATLLRLASQKSDDLMFDIDAAIRLSSVFPDARTVVFELSDELTLLANVLSTRADLARGFTIGLAGIGTDYAARNALHDLLTSLADEEGYSPGLSGDLGVNYVVANFARFDLNGDGVLTKEEINTLRCDAVASELSNEDMSALAAVAGRSSIGDSFTSQQLLELLRHNDALRLLGPLVAEVASEKRSRMTAEELENALITRSPNLADEISTLFDDELLVRSLTDGTPVIDLDTLLVRGINTGAYLHSGTAAIEFFERLPSAADRDIGIDVRLTNAAALAELHRVAAATTDDPLEVARFSYMLPETTSGFRNAVITRAYGAYAMRLEHYTNPDHPEGGPGPGGNTWPAFAASASYTVSYPIKGDESYLRFPIHHDSRQAIADGNQIIAASALPAFDGLILLYKYGTPTQADIDAYLSTFGDGQAELRQAMNKQIKVIDSDDPYDKQKLQLESNTLLGLHEQTIVDDKLNFQLMPLPLQAGAQVASGLESCLTSIQPLSVMLGTPLCSPNPRSGGEILTDTGTFKIKNGDETITEIPVDQLYTDGDKTNNLTSDLKLGDLDLSLSIPGQSELLSVADVTGVHTDPSIWVDDAGNAKPSVDWSQLNDRVPPIFELFQELQTDALLLEAAEYHAATPPAE